MEIDFSVDGTQAIFRRNHFTGRVGLSIADDTQTLQTPANLGTHFSLSSQRGWRQQINGHQVEIVQNRPMFLSALRPFSYQVLVDNEVVAQKTGY
jgi:hypothetical protein